MSSDSKFLMSVLFGVGVYNCGMFASLWLPPPRFHDRVEIDCDYMSLDAQAGRLRLIQQELAANDAFVRLALATSK